MRASRASLFKPTTAIKGADVNNPYCAYARNGPPSSRANTWLETHDIRHPSDGTWAPVRPEGNPVPTMGEFMVNWNQCHPVIEPLYHPKLTHNQKMTRLYKRCLVETAGKVNNRHQDVDVISFYMKQIRQEFEKNRNADKGTAEWLFHRAINYIETKKTKVSLAQNSDGPGQVQWARWHSAEDPDEWSVFPHGFDPEEAYKLQNPYYKYGIPYLGRFAAKITPQMYMMTSVNNKVDVTGEAIAIAVGRILTFGIIFSTIVFCATDGVNAQSADNYRNQSDVSIKGEMPRMYPALSSS